MKINLIDLKSQYANIENEINDAINEVLISSRFIMGENVEKLENEIAKFTGVNHGIGVGNGTDALKLTLKALEIGPGDEVITTPFTFFASAETTSVVGATPVFADIEEKSFCIDPKSIEEKITDKTKAIIPVHIFGQMCDMDKIMDIAERHNLIVIEDACQAIGAEYKGRKAGSIGHVGCYSFFPTKNLGAYGDGGMVVTNDGDLAEKIKLLRVHGSKVKYHHDVIGYNSRLDEMQAAILRVKFKYLEQWNNLRKEKAHIYNELLSDVDVELPVERQDCNHVYHLYTIGSDKRDDLISHLNKNGIATGIYYPIPVHMQPVYRYLNYKRGSLPVSERACTRTFALPLYPEITIEDQRYVAEKVIDFFEK